MNKFINEKANEMIKNLKNKMRVSGVELSSDAEYYIRIGMNYGLTLASLGLSNLRGITLELEGETNNETKIS